MIGAWHFVRETGLLRDGSKMEIGKTLVYAGGLELCESGYHASLRAIDALQYAPGPIICRVGCGGDIIHGDDKIVVRERTVLWSYDATAVLRFFARQCALDVIDLWDAPQVVRDYLETGDENLRDAARDAALAAAWTAARDAAWTAALAAAWTAARDAAWTAARTAARDAALDAARDAALDAAWDAQNALLESLLFAAAQDHGVSL